MSSIAEAALRGTLPSHISERVRLVKAGQVTSGFVLYWMRLALRGHENPALDAAIFAANVLKQPVVVLLQLEDRYPHATARRQLFLLQGVRSAEAELGRRGIPTIVQVDREGQRPDAVMELAKSASLLVAEEPFCVPWLAGTEKIQRGGFGCPVWLVDSSSVVPSALVPKQSCGRAWSYEKATARMHEARICKQVEDVQLNNANVPEDLVAMSLKLRDADLTTLVAEMDVDHAVKPIEHTIGGSAHGYGRWAAWIAAGGLKTYAKRRNESLDVKGVSRMSAYLNAGMVSPLRLAREANASPGAGKSKFLNEFLTWRGLSYAWCYHFPMPASGCTLSQLPAWASESLKQHASDSRRVISRDCLASACSNDRAWDGMQRYLVETGELHNNARMGWGCAIPKWTASPEDALRVLVDLNNTFALDGHAPPSYGGLLGCLGLFTGPKGETPVFGKVSARAPKAKYAALPDQISVLFAGLGAQASEQWAATKISTKHEANSSPSRPAEASAGGQVSLESYGWRKLEIAGMPEAASQANAYICQVSLEGVMLPAKRRWGSLKAVPQEADPIEIDSD